MAMLGPDTVLCVRQRRRKPWPLRSVAGLVGGVNRAMGIGPGCRGPWPGLLV